jgi:hypothetical protein
MYLQEKTEWSTLKKPVKPSRVDETIIAWIKQANDTAG